MTKFFSPDLDKIKPYIAGEQPQDRAYIKLNTNESPYPPSPLAVQAAADEAQKLNLYPDPACNILKKAAAETYGVAPENVLCGNGSDEILYFIFRAFCGKTKGMACPDVSYGFYPVLCGMLDIPYTAVPLADDFSINTRDYAAIKSNVCIANPNAQTGIYLDIKNVEQLLKQSENRIVVVDEAYIDFGGHSAVNLINKYSNLIVVRTMSKSHNLAGARVGFAFACRELIADLEAVRNSFNPYNINRMSMSAAEKSLKDVNYFTQCVSKIVEARAYTIQKLEELGFDILPSSANFILVKSGIVGGQSLYRQLKERGILVRYLGDERIADYVRITIGTREQMDALISATRNILKGE